MQFLNVEDLKPVYSGDRNAQNLFIAAFKGLVIRAAKNVSTYSSAVNWQDIESELWCSITENNWEMLRKYTGNGSFEGYFKRCLAFKRIDIGRKFTTKKHAYNVFETEVQKDYTSTPSSADIYAAITLETSGFLTGSSMFSPTVSESLEEHRDILLHTVLRCIEKLPTEDKLLIKMSMIDNTPAQHIAEVLNLKCITTCYTRKNRILARLRIMCKKHIESMSGIAA